jgi:hypothetical protein
MSFVSITRGHLAIVLLALVLTTFVPTPRGLSAQVVITLINQQLSKYNMFVDVGKKASSNVCFLRQSHGDVTNVLEDYLPLKATSK